MSPGLFSRGLITYSRSIRSSSESAHRRFPQACRGPLPSPHYLYKKHAGTAGAVQLLTMAAAAVAQYFVRADV